MKTQTTAMPKDCIVHYQNLKIKDKSKLTAVDENRYRKLLKSKNDRIELGGVHLDEHQNQCDRIPDEFVEGLWYHGECYKQFTGASISKKCIVHYNNIKIQDQNKVIPIDQDRYDKLVKAKNDRVELGGVHLADHQKQCDEVPAEFVEGHSYHKKCYKQFTRACSELKKKTEPSSASTESESTRPTRSSEKDDAGRFPNIA